MTKLKKISEQDAKRISSKKARSFRLDFGENNLLKTYARNHHQTDSEVIRNLIATLAFKGTEKEMEKAKKKQKEMDAELAKSVQIYTRKMDQIIALKQATYFLFKNFTNNLNQITHWINKYAENADSVALKAYLAQIRAQEQEIKQEIKRLDAKNNI